MVFKQLQGKAQKLRGKQKHRGKQRLKAQARAESFVRTHRDEIDASIAAAEQDWRSGRVASADELFDGFR